MILPRMVKKGAFVSDTTYLNTQVKGPKKTMVTLALQT